MIQFIHVYKAYSPAHYVLQDLCLQIDPGEFVFLIGPSGVGKTTFFKLIYREELPNKGEILVAGFNLKVLPASKLPYLRQKIGIVFQDFKLLPELNVYENIALGLQILGYPVAYIKQKTCELSEKLDLERKLNSKVGTLSTGEKQRVVIARALAHQPPILLADEPTSNLDARRSLVVIDLFRELNSQGSVVIFATHNRDLTNLVPKARIMELREGAIQERK